MLILAGVASMGVAAPLDRQLDLALDHPALKGATVAAVVMDPSSGELLYERAADSLVLPASTMKWPTAVAAAELLGLDWRFETVLGIRGRVDDGTLDGDLVVLGSGDPSLGQRDPAGLLGAWAAAVRERGITRIAGRLIADPSVVGDAYLGSGWAWDDVPHGYSAPVSGINLGGNLLTLRVRDVGGRPQLDAGPFSVCVEADLDVALGEGAGLVLAREPWRERWVLRGTIPNGGSRTLTTPMSDPPRCVALALGEALTAAGIDIDGGAGAGISANPAELEPVHRSTSPPLSELLEVMLKRSDNLYAEAIARALDPELPHTFRGARTAMSQVLVRAGIDAGRLRLADGSGLSRYGLVSARALAELTSHTWSLPAHAALRDMLPVAGVDGTLAPRLRGTAAAGRVQAKTGSMTGVRNLVGFVRDRDERDLVFAVLFTSFVAPQSEAIAIQDAAIELVALSRRGRLRRRDARRVLR